MRLTGLAGRIVDESVGDGSGILGEIGAVGVEAGEQVWDDGADALAGSGGGEGEEGSRAVVAQQPAGLAAGLDFAADDEPAAARP